MDIKHTICDAQKNLLDELALFEATIAELYEAYASAFPEQADFWMSLSQEEQMHNHYLLSLYTILDKGCLFSNLARFNRDFLHDEVAQMRRDKLALSAGPVSLLQALENACSIEVSVLDGHFYDTVQADAPEFVAIAAHLAGDTARHRQILLDAYAACRAKRF